MLMLGVLEHFQWQKATTMRLRLGTNSKMGSSFSQSARIVVAGIFLCTPCTLFTHIHILHILPLLLVQVIWLWRSHYVWAPRQPLLCLLNLALASIENCTISWLCSCVCVCSCLCWIFISLQSTLNCQGQTTRCPLGCCRCWCCISAFYFIPSPPHHIRIVLICLSLFALTCSRHNLPLSNSMHSAIRCAFLCAVQSLFWLVRAKSTFFATCTVTIESIAI